MIPAVQSALNSILGNNPVLSNASGAGRAFELYIMTGIAVEMQFRGFDVWLQRSDGTRIFPGDPNQAFIQRGGAPTGVPAASAGANNASVIGMSRPGGAIWELWNGIQFRGRSGGLHEIDISLVPDSVASNLRIAGGCPLGRPRVAIECKDHVSTGSPDEMRAFVARLYDLSLLEGHRGGIFQTPPRRQWPSIQEVRAAPFTRRSKHIGTRIEAASMRSRVRAASVPALAP